MVVVGAADGDLGVRVFEMFKTEADTSGDKGAARVSSVAGVSLADARAVAKGGGGGGEAEAGIGDVRAALSKVKTLVIMPADPEAKKGAGFGGMFGGGGGSNEGSRLLLSEEEVCVYVCVCVIWGG